MASSHHHGGSHGYNSNLSSGGNYRAQYQHQTAAESGFAFTSEMRDRQARGKDPYRNSSDSSDDGDWAYRGPKEESFAVVEKRREAASVLDCPEMLMMHAQRDGDSIPATRLRYTKILSGYTEKPSKTSPSRKTATPHSHRSTSGTSRRTSDRTTR